MQSTYLSRITYSEALAAQSAAILRLQPTILGFEAEPVVTLGRRAVKSDIISSPNGFEILSVDRGGQATIHNPGQLVIFPAVKIEGVRKWIKLLAEVTIETLGTFEIESRWDDTKPGLFTSKGKIMACGLRVKNSWNTHGIAINVCNDLTPFAGIRACGIDAAEVDRMGANFNPAQVFKRWCTVYEDHILAERGQVLTFESE